MHGASDSVFFSREKNFVVFTKIYPLKYLIYPRGRGGTKRLHLHKGASPQTVHIYTYKTQNYLATYKNKQYTENIASYLQKKDMKTEYTQNINT